jgi:hypothetical protein
MKILQGALPLLVGSMLVAAGSASAQRSERSFLIGYTVSRRLMVFGSGDFGLHNGADAAVALRGEFDVDTYHYMGKVGYVVYENPVGRLRILLNAGLGAMTIKLKPDQGDEESRTYFAINVGAKLHYLFAENIGFLLSPQGDIAFSKEEDFGDAGASSSWVWPFSAGFFVTF